MTDAIPVTLIPGDGIGPEIVGATVKIVEASGAKIEWDRQLAGMTLRSRLLGLWLVPILFTACGRPSAPSALRTIRKPR